MFKFVYMFKIAIYQLYSDIPFFFRLLAVISIGISLFLSASVTYTSSSKNPLKEKNSSVFAVQLDSWDEKNEFEGLDNLPLQVTYRDGIEIIKSEIPKSSALMFQSGVRVTPKDQNRRVFFTPARVTNNDFFELFDVPFQYGSPWTQDDNSQNVVVLSKTLNNSLFRGVNSVGKTVEVDGVALTVSGVTDSWHPRPKIHDLSLGAFSYRDSLYIPLNFSLKLEPAWWGKRQAWESKSTTDSYDKRLKSEATWLQLWVELPNAQTKKDFESYLEAYIKSQKKIGRFRRPSLFVLNRPSEWLKKYQVVGPDIKLLVAASFFLFFVCLTNASVLLLVNYLRKNTYDGIYRALGASRKDILIRHAFEVFVYSLFGLLLGLLIMPLWLVVYAGVMPSPEWVDNFSYSDLSIASVVAFMVTFLVCMLPAWVVTKPMPAKMMGGA